MTIKKQIERIIKAIENIGFKFEVGGSVLDFYECDNYKKFKKVIIKLDKSNFNLYFSGCMNLNGIDYWCEIKTNGIVIFNESESFCSIEQYLEWVVLKTLKSALVHQIFYE